MKFVVAIIISLTFSLTAAAARPFVTDDARLTTPGSCQIESWVRIYPNSTEAWALPACNPTGKVELTIGGGRATNDSEKPTNDYVFQAKTLVRALETNDWGWGVAIGTIRHPEISPGPNLLGNTFLNIPVSISLNSDQLVLHANLGWLKDKASGTQSLTWGIGGELKITERSLGIIESFGDSLGQSYGQIGYRYSIVPDLLQLDTTLGRQLSGTGNSRWVSFGVRFTPDKFL